MMQTGTPIHLLEDSKCQTATTDCFAADKDALQVGFEGDTGKVLVTLNVVALVILAQWSTLQMTGGMLVKTALLKIARNYFDKRAVVELISLLIHFVQVDHSLL